MNPKAAKPYEPVIIERLKDDEYAVEYLNLALQEEDPRHFLLAVRQLTEARGVGMTELARETQLQREGLYKILSEKGNPELQTLTTLLAALGFGLQVTCQKKSA